VLIGYDKASQRMSATSASGTENYSYTADGYLQTVTIGGVVRAARTTLRHAQGDRRRLAGWCA
jgi:hypothetical protein